MIRQICVGGLITDQSGPGKRVVADYPATNQVQQFAFRGDSIAR
jgi:hypothetical protein